MQKITRLLFTNASHWNEQDLSMHFIGPMFSLVGFTERSRFNLFAQSSLTGIVDGVTLTGRVDELIASGFRIPKVPFFAFNEYKKEMEYKRTFGDFDDPDSRTRSLEHAGKCPNSDFLSWEHKCHQPKAYVICPKFWAIRKGNFN